jgi:hypothetical protein
MGRKHKLPPGVPVWTYAWGNNEKRKALKGRQCVILAHGRMRTVLVYFLDSGEQVTTSRWALRAPKPSNWRS